MKFIMSKEERLKQKQNKLLSKESINQLNDRLIEINKQFIDKVQELENIRSNLVSLKAFQDAQQDSEAKLLSFQTSIYEELNKLTNTMVNDLLKKNQEFILSKNHELTEFYQEVYRKVASIETKIIEYDNLKEQITQLTRQKEVLSSEITRINDRENIYRDEAIQYIDDVIQSDKVISAVADKGSQLILNTLNKELSAFTVKEQKTFVDAIRLILENRFSSDVIRTIETFKEANELHNDEIFHNSYQKVKNTVLAGVIPMVVGPAGSGKSHAVEQIARDLGLDFYMANRIQNTFELVGFVDAAGKYVTTQFFEAFTKGGLFFFDEVDASSPEALVTINAAVAQKHMAFPGHAGNIPMHKDFKAVVAGNTYGTGSTFQYTGRNKLDAATLDRFMVIDWDYDRELEKKKINDKQLLELCWSLRDVVNKLQSEFIKSSKNRDNTPYDSIIISTRGIENLEKIIIQEAKTQTMTKEELFKSKFFASAKKEALNLIKIEFNSVKDIQKNKYFKVIEKVLTA
jgi:hypothetical protein